MTPSLLLFKQLCHVLDQVVVESQFPDLLFKLSQFLVAVHHEDESLVQSLVFHNKFSDILLLLRQLASQVFDVPLSTLHLVLVVVSDADFVGAEVCLELRTLVLDGCIRFHL